MLVACCLRMQCVACAALLQAIVTILKQLPLTDYARLVQWILKYSKNAKVCCHGIVELCDVSLFATKLQLLCCVEFVQGLSFVGFCYLETKICDICHCLFTSCTSFLDTWVVHTSTVPHRMCHVKAVEWRTVQHWKTSKNDFCCVLSKWWFVLCQIAYRVFGVDVVSAILDEPEQPHSIGTLLHYIFIYWCSSVVKICKLSAVTYLFLLINLLVMIICCQLIS